MSYYGNNGRGNSRGRGNRSDEREDNRYGRGRGDGFRSGRHPGSGAHRDRGSDRGRYHDNRYFEGNGGDSHHANHYDRRGGYDERQGHGHPSRRDEASHPRGGDYRRPAERGGDHYRARSRSTEHRNHRPGDLVKKRKQWERNGIDVLTNFYKVDFKRPGEQTWYQYHLTINHVKKIFGENQARQREFLHWEVGKSIFDDRETESLSDLDRKLQEKRNRSSHLSRRIINELVKKEGVNFVSDGTQNAWAANPLYGLTRNPDERKTRNGNSNSKGESAPGIYGPADPGGSAPNQVPLAKPWKVFEPLKILMYSNEESGFETGCDYRWFQVKVTQVGVMEMNVQEQKVTHVNIDGQQVGQAMQLAVNSAMMAHMIALARSPRMFFFKHIPIRIGQPSFDPSCMPLYGLMQSIRLSSSGSAVISADLGIGWKATGQNERGERISLLQTPELRSLHLDPRYPVPQDKRNDFVGILTRLSFDVRYERPKEWVEEQLNKPISERMRNAMKHLSPNEQDKSMRERNNRIRKKAVILKLNRHMPRPPAQDAKDQSPSIYWSADNRNEYSFPYTSSDGITEQRTVAEHFLKSHKIRLEFPNMPLVLIGNQKKPFLEYIPLEFLFLSSESIPKGRGEHDDRMLQHTLAVNDEYACSRRIHQITQLLQEKSLAEQMREKFNLLNLQMNPRPMEVKAKVLKEPNIVYSMENPVPIDIKNGAWDLRDVKFHKPARLNSFAVVDLSNDRSRCIEMVTGLLERLTFHGVLFGSTVPYPVRSNMEKTRQLVMDLVTASQGNPEVPEVLTSTFREAKDRTWKRSTWQSFQNDVCYHTIASVQMNQSKETANVAVLPRHLVERVPEGTISFLEEGQYACAVQPREREPHDMEGWSEATHKIKPYSEGPMYAIFFYRIENSQRRFVDLPPYGVRMNYDGNIQYFTGQERGFVTLSSKGTCKPMFKSVDYPEKHWELDQIQYFEVGECTGVKYVSDTSIVTTSIIFVILQDKETSLYNLSKCTAYEACGVNSQTMTVAAFQRQKWRPDPYFSNIALKVNAKIGNVRDQACAWCWSRQLKDGSSDPERLYLDETPTMIVGLSLASSQGQDSKMVVAGTVLLDIEGQQCAYEAHAQEKSHQISRTVVKSMFKNFISSFLHYHKREPKRIIIIRDSGHDGLFQEIRQVELGAVREAFVELKCEFSREKWPCQACESLGCFQCCPLLTCVVSQTTQRKIKLAPASEEDKIALASRRQRERRTVDLANVPSGTCVDAADLLLPPDGGVQDEHKESNLEDKKINETADRAQLKLFTTEGNQSQDFFLVANGGLKGTSKGVQYRVIWNENLFRGDERSSSLTTDRIQRLIFALSFLYSKATKAPRETSIVKTASQLANTLLGSMSALGRDRGPIQREHNIGNDGNTESGILLGSFGQVGLHPHVVA